MTVSAGDLGGMIEAGSSTDDGPGRFWECFMEEASHASTEHTLGGTGAMGPDVRRDLPVPVETNYGQPDGCPYHPPISR